MGVLLVTGAAGFIGSTLVDRLLRDGHHVRGIDCFTDYYDPAIKHRNLEAARANSRFELIEDDLVGTDLQALLRDVDCCFHLAAQAGVRASWGREFRHYIHCNIDATQRLLEAARQSGLPKIVYSSSSSVYGNARQMPMSEDALPSPLSPYGVTKLSAEQMCALYHHNYGLQVVSLRYFTVYGPRQRPDMAFHKFIRAGLRNEPIEVYGDGNQTRDFTFVEDVVEANIAAMRYTKPLGIFNVGGGANVGLQYVVGLIEKAIDRKLRVEFKPPVHGDVRDTHADTRRVTTELGWRARVPVEEGIPAEAAWLQTLGA